MAGMAAAGTAAAVEIRMDKEAFSDTIRANNINKVGEDCIRQESKGKMNNSINGGGPDAVPVALNAGHLAETTEMVHHELSGEGGGGARHTYRGDGISGQPTINHGVVGGGPGNTSLELGQRGGASGGGGKSNTKKLRRWHEKDVRDISNTKTRLA
jgi:hypothetical protein